jgi:hypothetical protein
MAKFLGDTTAEYRWFAVVYMVAMFAVLPAIFIGLSFAGSIYVICLVSIVGVIIVVIVIISLLQNKSPKFLPPMMRTWEWVPLPLRSLKPYDDLFTRMSCCAKCNPANPEDDKKHVTALVIDDSTDSSIDNDVHTGSSTVDDRNNFVYFAGGSTTRSSIPLPPPVLEDNNSHNNHHDIDTSNSISGHELSLGNGNGVKHNNNPTSNNGRGISNSNHFNESVGNLGSDNEGYNKGSSESVIV